MKVRDVVTSLPCDGATALAVIGALGDAGLLDAEVIGLPCKTCGGSGFRTRTLDDDMGQPYHETDTCPDCTDTPVYVIAPEAWEAVATVIKAGFAIAYAHAGEIDGDEFPQTIAAEVLQALLPARVAKVVGHIHDNSPGDPTFYLWTDGDAADVDGYAIMAHDIAILAEQEEE